MISEQEIRKLLGSIEIPSCPAVLSELMVETGKDDCDLQRVAALVSRDVALSAGVLKIANSPLFGLRSKLSSIHQAVNFLGMGNVLSLVTGELLHSALGKEAMSLNRFWDNTVLTAQVCQKLSRRLGDVDPQSAYLFGLFHDAGIPVMLKRFPEYRETLKTANFAIDASFTQVEDAAHGTNHAVIGHFFARSWGLPKELADAILMHHDYDVFKPDENVAVAVRELVAIALVAEHAIGMQLRMSEETEWVKGHQAMADYFGFSAAELLDLVDDIGDEVTTLRGA